MKVFISWSGPQAQAMAEALKSWLKDIIFTIEPFFSSHDIPKGDRGLPVIADELEACTAGIVCVTRENNTAPWINFEAGALSKIVGRSRVIPLLLDLSVADLTGPLTQFQAVRGDDEEEVFAMVRALRDHGRLADQMDDQRLRRVFDAFWPALRSAFDAARAKPGQGASGPARETNEILEEVLVLVRRHDTTLRELAERSAPAAPDVMAVAAEGPEQSSDRGGKIVRDELLPRLELPLEAARTYRYDTSARTAHLTVNLVKDSITPGNIQRVREELKEFVDLSRIVTELNTEDGVSIAATGSGFTRVTVPEDPIWREWQSKG